MGPAWRIIVKMGRVPDLCAETLPIKQTGRHRNWWRPVVTLDGQILAGLNDETNCGTILVVNLNVDERR